jgi:hypothetical protein
MSDITKYRDHFGRDLNVGDEVEYFRVYGGPEGGDTKDWRGGMPATVVELGGRYPDSVVIDLGPSGYDKPYDRILEAAYPYKVVKVENGA